MFKIQSFPLTFSWTLFPFPCLMIPNEIKLSFGLNAYYNWRKERFDQIERGFKLNFFHRFFLF